MHTHPRQARQFVVDHGGHVKLEQFDIFSYDVSCSAALLVSPQLVVDFDNVSQLVGQVILQKQK